jgi:hypothetical protein
MTVTFVVGWLVLLAAAWAGVRAYRIDRELRRLLPAVIERRWERASLREPETLWDAIRRPVIRLPARWHRELHAERGAALFDEMCLCAGFANLLTVVGIALMVVGS